MQQPLLQSSCGAQACLWVKVCRPRSAVCTLSAPPGSIGRDLVLVAGEALVGLGIWPYRLHTEGLSWVAEPPLGQL